MSEQKQMKIQLSDHFSYRKLLRFTLPSIVMMIVTSLYSIVDGLFVSNLVGDMAFSAVNIVMPITMIVGAFGFMLGTGGSAVVAKTMGMGEDDLANRYFSLIITAVAVTALVASVLCIVFIEPLMRLAGASDLLMDDCIRYGRIMLAGSLMFMLQVAFQSFLVVAEKPQMGLAVSVAAGITNMIFDYVLIKIAGMGIEGAAYATVLGYCVAGGIPLFYFLFCKKSRIRLVIPKFYGKVLIEACTNGSSEMMNNIATSIVSILFNVQLMKMIGEQGVAAFGVMMYVDFIFLGTFMGFSMGSAPVISYHYGAKNHDELKNLFRKCMIIIGGFSIVMVISSQLLCEPLSRIFVGYDAALLEMTVHGFHLFALNYLFCGINVFGSAFFTALCNGKVSALLAFLRSFLFRGGMVLVLPVLFGVDGIWYAVAAAELLAAVFTVAFFVRKRKIYHYA